MEQQNVYAYLSQRAVYAIRSRSRDLVYQTYGEACMAAKLGAITKGQFYDLNTQLVHDTMNGRIWPEFK